jgi:hypothetical protein
VDNEMPLANVDSPIENQPQQQQHTLMGTSITTANFQLFDEIHNSSNNIHSITNVAVDDDDHIDANNIMMRNTNDNTNDSNMLSKSNNLGDSYNNLFRDSKQSNEINNQFNEIEVIDEPTLPVTAMKTKMTPLRKNFRSIENVYSNVVPTTTSTTTAEIALEVAAAGANMSTAASPSSTTTLLDNSTISNEFNKSDPNLHVYSNISSPKSAIKKRTTSSTNVSLTQMDDENSILNSSFLLTNDLDLDDPVFTPTNTTTTTPTAKKIFNSTFNTSATVSNSGGRYLKQNAIKTTNINTMLDATASSANSTTTTSVTAPASKIATIEMKNILPKIGIVEPKTSTPASSAKSKSVNPNIATSNYNGGSSSTATMGKTTNTSVSSNAPFISPNRRRLLHDTTMIDTALDLDSLDGSSIGNSSQVTLSKTAVV